jgi:photosystem II stability/assembly factor-like uncharacterized protein
MFAVTCALVGAVSVAKRGSDHWTIIGPGGGGALFEPTISPRDPDYVLIASDMTGSYVTDDGGASWRMFNLRGPVRFFAFDPANDKVAYAGGIGLWRSDNAGRTWTLVYPSPANVTRVSMADDHASEKIVTDGSWGTVGAFAVDPANSEQLYLIVQKDSNWVLETSANSGRNWRALAEFPIAVHGIYVDPRSSRLHRRLYLSGDNQVLLWDGDKWKAQPSPPGVSRFQLSAAFPRDNSGPVFYAASREGVFVSDDGGGSWLKSEFGSEAHFRAIAASPSSPDIAYVSYHDLNGKWFGVARTDDRGQHWNLLWKEAAKAGSNIHDSWITQFFGPGYGDNPLSLGVSPSNPDIVYSGDTGRVMRTVDGGKTWDQLYSTQLSSAGFAGRGLHNTTCYGIHFDPFNRQRVFISYTDIGLFRSDDGGQSWTSSITGVPAAWRNTTYWMVFDPQVRGRAWAVMSAVHDLPRAKMWARKSPSTYDGGVVISDDGGITWRKSSEGMPPSAATDILLDTSSPANSRVLYVTAFGRGVYKSSDGGKSWSLKNHGIAGTEPFAWRLTQDSAGTLYLVVARRSDDGSIDNPGDGALYRSTDGAEHWARVKLPDAVNGPNGLAVDRHDPQRLYLAAWARSTPSGAIGGGVYVSNDGGNTWRQTLSKDQHIYDITIDDKNNNVLYATGFESSVWRSTDAGKTWNRIPGFNFKWAHRVIPDPSDDTKVYVTTFGSSVWHGPAKGDFSAPDEIATPRLQHQR